MYLLEDCNEIEGCAQRVRMMRHAVSQGENPSQYLADCGELRKLMYWVDEPKFKTILQDIEAIEESALMGMWE